MEPAPEQKELVTRLYEAFSRGDADLMEGLMSRQQGMLFIGTGPNEWGEDVAPIRRTCIHPSEQ